MDKTITVELTIKEEDLKRILAVVEVKSNEEEEESRINDLFLMPVDGLELTVRSANCLKCVDIDFVGDLIQLKESDVKAIPNLGRKSLREIKEQLRCLRLTLNWGMEIKSKAALNRVLERMHKELKRIKQNER